MEDRKARVDEDVYERERSRSSLSRLLRETPGIRLSRDAP